MTRAHYHAALAADNAWHAELTRVYGRRAGDMRYRAEGKATPALHALWAAKRAADEACFGAPIIISVPHIEET